MKTLKSSQGRVVAGDTFWGREKDIELLTKRFENGGHVLLVAQRRMGKTSLMAELERQLNEQYICLFVDLEDACNASDAIASLSSKCKQFNGVWEKTKGVFSNVLSGIEEVQIGEIKAKIRGGLSRANWKEKADQLLDVLANEDKKVLLMLDEVPILVNRMLKGNDYKITPERRGEVDEFMSWLRKNSIKHQSRISFIISGSIGLGPVLRQAGLSATINNIIPYELKPWDDDTAKACLEALANEYGISYEKGTTAAIVEMLGCCIPHHVQMFFVHIYEMCIRKDSTECTIENAKNVYETDMLGFRGNAELTHYEERLKLVVGQEQFPLVTEMITEAAVVGHLSYEVIELLAKEYKLEGCDTINIQKELLWILEHDGYLKQNENGYVFESRLLRDWWRKVYKNFYTPVQERGE